MDDFLQRLKQRKLVQWAVAYLAAAWVLLQVLDLASGSYNWPNTVMHVAFGVLAVGFVVTLVLAWYHGERGAQRVSGMELLIVALVLVVGGGVLWNFSRNGSTTTVTSSVAHTGSPDAAQRLRLQEMQTRTAEPARRVSDRDVANQSGTDNPPDAAAAASSGLRIASVPITAQPIPAKSVAALPFENLSTSKDNAYFADGMQDLILTKLADIGDLKVISRTSTAKYASRPDDPKIIGQQLGVATILEGSVQKAGNQVLINVQLIDAKTDSHIWAQDYTRTLDNIFGVEGEVAEKVANVLNAKLTAREASAVTHVPTTNAAAYDAYLRGEYHLNNFSAGLMKPDVLSAVREYSEAVAHDPKFALAWARLATAQVFLGAMTHDDPERASALFGGAKASITKAMALRHDLAAAYTSQGILDIWPNHDWHTALQMFQKAHALQPQSANALWWIAYALDGLGKNEEYIRVVRQLQVIDPKRAPAMLGNAEANLHRFGDAERMMQRAVAINPDSWTALDSLASLYAYLGDLPAMGKLISDAPASVKNNPNFIDTAGTYLFYRRDWDAARKLYAHAREPENLRAAFYPVEIKRGDVEWYAGDKTAAVESYRQSIPLLQAQLKQQPARARWHAEFGWVYARLGRDTEALQQARLALRSQTAPAEVIRRAPRQALILASIEVQIGKTGDAIVILDTLLAQPTGWTVSVPMLKMSPVWDPIRHDPRFQALLKKYGKPQTTSPASAVSAATP